MDTGATDPQTEWLIGRVSMANFDGCYHYFMLQNYDHHMKTKFIPPLLILLTFLPLCLHT